MSKLVTTRVLMTHDPVSHQRGLPFINKFLRGELGKKHDYSGAALIIKDTLVELGLADSKQKLLRQAVGLLTVALTFA